MAYRVYVDVETEKDANRVLEMFQDAYSAVTNDIKEWSKKEAFDKYSKDSIDKTLAFLNAKADDYQRFVFNATYEEID